MLICTKEKVSSGLGADVGVDWRIKLSKSKGLGAFAIPPYNGRTSHSFNIPNR